MRWIATPQKDTDNTTLEKNLWAAADQFRANSGLKAQEYSGPILGLIFLRFAEMRFGGQRAKLEQATASSRRGSPWRPHRLSRRRHPLPPGGGPLRLPAQPSRGRADIGAKVNEAMREIEKHNPQLAGVLPKTYNLFTSTLLKELLKKVSEIPASVDYDAFGRIYEYFLGEFARPRAEGRRVLHPDQHRQAARRDHRAVPRPHLRPRLRLRRHVRAERAIRGEHQKSPAAELAIYGVEKADETGSLCR